MPQTVAPIPTFRWTRARYERLAETGVLEGADVELIDGELVEVEVTHSGRHAVGITKTQRALAAAYPEAIIRVQLPLALTDDSEPEPDVAVVDGRPDDFIDQHPTTARLVVEVSDESLRFDRTRKASLYARAGLPVYWIVNLVEDCVEVFSHPHGAESTSSPGTEAVSAGYATHRVCRRGELVAPGIAVDDLLPAR
jgi:Uma2 family endonuclease